MIHMFRPAAVGARAAMLFGGVLGLMAFSACDFPGSTSSSSSAASPSVSATGSGPSASPAIEVVGAGGADPAAAAKGVHECGASYSCMITKRLSDRLKAASASVPADLTCRCQNSGTITYKLQSQNGIKAFATMDLGLGAAVKPLRWTMVQVAGSWYADDQDCGSAATSIYTTTAPCA